MTLFGSNSSLSNPYMVGGNWIYHLSSLPTSGYSFNVGDQVWITNPTANSPTGYICVGAGDYNTSYPSFVPITTGSVVTLGNLLSNPGFETASFSGWTKSGSGLSQVSNPVHSGSLAAKSSSSTDSLYQTITLPQVKTYTFSVWAEINLTGGGNQMQLVFQTTGGTQLVAQNFSLTTTWTKYSIQYSNPTANSQIVPLISSATTSPSYYNVYDDCSVN